MTSKNSSRTESEDKVEVLPEQHPPYFWLGHEAEYLQREDGKGVRD